MVDDRKELTVSCVQVSQKDSTFAISFGAWEPELIDS